MRAGLGLEPSWWGWSPGFHCCVACHMASVILSIDIMTPVGHSWAGPFTMPGLEVTGVEGRWLGTRGQCGLAVALCGHQDGVDEESSSWQLQQVSVVFSRPHQMHTVGWGRPLAKNPSSHPPEPSLCRALPMAQMPHLLSSFCTPNALSASGKTSPTAVISSLHRCGKRH